MFFYRYRVRESHLNRYAGCLHTEFLLSKSQRVAALGQHLEVHKIFDTTSRNCVYFIVDLAADASAHPKKSSAPHPAVIAFCSMSKMPRWVALETTMLYVSPAHRRLGLARRLYDTIMKDGVIIMSGYSHNQKSRRLWMSIVQNNRYIAWAHDILDLDRYADILIEDGTIECSLKIYEDIKKMKRLRRQDIRIIAYNPKYI